VWWSMMVSWYGESAITRFIVLEEGIVLGETHEIVENRKGLLSQHLRKSFGW
jgi:hypothetical protein